MKRREKGRGRDREGRRKRQKRENVIFREGYKGLNENSETRETTKIM